MVLFGSSLGHFWVKKFRPSQLRYDKIELFLAKNKEKVLKTEVFRTFRGGDKRDRTADLLNAIQALSQLSYTPICAVSTDLAQGVCYQMLTVLSTPNFTFFEKVF